MKKTTGFTLIELLAVIVVLGIIMLIAVTAVSGIINNSRKESFKKDAQIILKNIDYNDYINNNESITTINETNLESKIGLSSSNYQKVEISIVDTKPYIIVIGNNKWNNLMVYGTYDNMNVTTSDQYNNIKSSFVYNEEKGVNKPMLATGMTPIKWNGSSWVDTTESDTSWYDYPNKVWANARTNDGSMWVWIPRYIYKISTGWHTNTAGTIDIQFSKGTNDNWNSASLGSINTDTTASASNNTWTNHPGFTFGNDELNGIWIAKFEATAAEGVDNGYMADYSCPSTNDNVTTKTIKITPNARSWRCIQIGNMFTNARNMETNSIYGWGSSGDGIDTHLMKNVEWGTIAYLSKSVTYGQGDNEIWINNANDYTTGCAGASAGATASTTGCLNTYDTTNGVRASTTGTIYGIYDVSGGSSELVASYVDNASTQLTQGASITGAPLKYRDVYTKAATDNQANNYALTANRKGDVVYETSSNPSGANGWFGDYSHMPSVSAPWFVRSGFFTANNYAGMFYSYTFWGGASGQYSFRPVLVVKSGL